MGAYVIEVDENGTLAVLYDDELLCETKDMTVVLNTIGEHYSQPPQKPDDPLDLGRLFRL